MSPKPLASKSSNVVWQESVLTREERWRRLRCKGGTVWLTGLSASGKSTIATELVRRLVERGRMAYRLDGDNLRHGLNRDLGFSATDREENIRRSGEVARLFADSGAIAVAGLISPYAADRNTCREIHESDDLTFLEVFVDAPLEVCEQRDPKGLYRRARAGEIKGFTGIDDPYEAPVRPQLVLATDRDDVETCVQKCMALLSEQGLI